MSLSNQASDTGNIQLLASILNEIGAAEYLQAFIDDDRDDDSIKTLANIKTERIASKYRLPLDKAAAFTDRCRSISSSSLASDIGVSLHRDIGQPSPIELRTAPPSELSPRTSADVEEQSFPSSSLPSSRDSSLVPSAMTAISWDDATIIRMLNMEMICELGKGGFGTVYEAKNLADRLKVALKIVKDPQNAIHAVREGQRLRRIKHKNIVLMHKVHDIDGGPCALEMEVVPGGDLSQHLEACRRRPTVRLPRDAVLRFSRQLLEALVYLHDECKWLHGDIKPQNILMQCNRVPADGSAVDYSNAEIKLADFGLTKTLDQQSAMSSLVLSTMVGVLKGTMLYLSPEAMQGASSGGSYERVVSDDLWSACLVMLEMDTGMPIHQLVKGPGSVVIDELLTKTSPELLPLLCSVLAVPSAASRCNSAAELLRMLDASLDPLFKWQLYDTASLKYTSVHPASSVFLEGAFSANEPIAGLPLPAPLDYFFDIQAMLSSPTALGFQTEKRSGKKCRIRRVLRASVLNSSQNIPTWQELIDGKEWLQCSPATCAKLDIDAKNPNAVIDAARYRHLALESGSIGQVQLPHPMTSEPYLAPAHADDIVMLNRRVHDSLPEWDVTEVQQVVNTSLASKYAAYRHRVAARCNGNPNERMMFHFADPAVMTKIWQQGEGHDSRLSQWAEVGKGAYFSKHAMYGYAYKYCLWPSPPSFTVKPEPPIGERMPVFVSLVCLGNVADMGPGCETCTSFAWEAWKKELPILPKPTRPPAMMLPADAAEKQHVLDLMQVKDVPRCDSVMSTEGDLGTHFASTSKDASGRRICDIMHPRLRARAREWAEQCVLFDAAASYPMFVVTLTKNRDSPMGLQQLMDAGCDADRLKALGFTASHTRALGKTAREMRAAGWLVTDMKGAGFEADALLAGGYSLPDLIGAGFLASSLKAVGCSAKELKDIGFTALELGNGGFDLSALDQAGFTLEELKSSNFSDLEISQTASFAIATSAMDKVREHFAALHLLGASRARTPREAENSAAPISVPERVPSVSAVASFHNWFKARFLRRIEISLATEDLINALRHPAIAKNIETAALLRSMGVEVYYASIAGFEHQTLASAGYSVPELTTWQNAESSFDSHFVFLYRRRKLLFISFFAVLACICLGLLLGDTISIMILVACFPIGITFLAHWKCVTSNGSKYPTDWVKLFASFFIIVTTLSGGFLFHLESAKIMHMAGYHSVAGILTYNVQVAIMVFGVCVPFILVRVFCYCYLSPLFDKYQLQFWILFFLCFIPTLLRVTGIIDSPYVVKQTRHHYAFI